MKIVLKPETRLLFQSEPVIFSKEQLDKIECFLNGKVKEYQKKNLLSFIMYDLKEAMVFEKEPSINIEDFYISDYNSSLLFISNLKTCLNKKDFKFLREYLEIDFYSTK